MRDSSRALTCLSSTRRLRRSLSLPTSSRKSTRSSAKKVIMSLSPSKAWRASTTFMSRPSSATICRQTHLASSSSSRWEATESRSPCVALRRIRLRPRGACSGGTSSGPLTSRPKSAPRVVSTTTRSPGTTSREPASNWYTLPPPRNTTLAILGTLCDLLEAREQRLQRELLIDVEIQILASPGHDGHQARVVFRCRHGRPGELVGAVAVPEYIGCPTGDHPEVAHPGGEEVDGVLRRDAPQARFLALGALLGFLDVPLSVAIILELLLEHVDEGPLRIRGLVAAHAGEQQRDLLQELRPAARAARIVRQPLGALHGAAREARERRGLGSTEAVPLAQVRGDLLVAERTKLDLLTTGDDRRQHALETVRDEQEVHVVRRLFDALQQLVGRRRVQVLDLGDDPDAAAGSERLEAEVGDHRPHLLEADEVTFALDHVQVGVDAAARTLALGAGPAAAAGADERHGELAREGRLGQALGAAQQVRVAESALAQGAREHLFDLLLAGDVVEHGAPLAAAPQAGGGDRLERRGLHVDGDDVDVAEAVDQTHALREAPRHHGEAGGDPLLEIEAFGLDAVGRAAGARQPHERIDVEDDREVGQQAAQTRLVDGQHRVDAQSAGEALIGERRVDEAVEDEHAAGAELGQQHALDELGAGRGVQQGLGPGRQRLGTVQEYVAHGLTGRGAAGFADCLLYTSDAADDLLCVDL